MTSHRTFLALHAAQAFAALLLTGFGLPLASNPAEVELRFFVEPFSLEAGDCEALEPLCSRRLDFSFAMMTADISMRWLQILVACDY